MFNKAMFREILLPMEGSVSSTTAEIYMQAHEHTAIPTALHPLKVWE